MEIKILNKHGKSLRSIERVGVSVNTVRKYLRYDSSLNIRLERSW